jgi:hypothetical protein
MKSVDVEVRGWIPSMLDNSFNAMKSIGPSFVSPERQKLS